MRLSACSGQTFEAQPLAVLFHEEDHSPASGLRFGRVEVLLRGRGWVERGLLPLIGAKAMARKHGVLLVDDQRQIDTARPGRPLWAQEPAARRTG
jgi:hypothetical protein